MCCRSDSASAPIQHLVSPTEELVPKTVKELTAQLSEIEGNPSYQAYKHLQNFPPHYNDAYTPWTIATRLACVALSIAGIATYVLFLSGHLWTFPQEFMHWIYNINPINAGIGAGITCVLIAGASWVIHKARTKEDKLLKSGRGAIENVGSHLETICATYTCKKGEPHSANFYIDKSTIKEEGHEKAYLYNVKDPCSHYVVSTEIVFFATPIYLVGTIVYNVLRTVIVPFYILFQYVKEKCMGTRTITCNPTAPGNASTIYYVEGRAIDLTERCFELLDIPKEMIKSISRVLQAPFYALAFFMAGLYSLVNPMGGRKLGALIECDWNGEESLAEGYWSVGGPQELYRFEGGGGPNGLGRGRFVLAGCWAPAGIAEYVDGQLDKAYYLPKAIDARAGVDYTIYTLSDLEKYVRQDQDVIDALALDAKHFQIELDSRATFC